MAHSQLLTYVFAQILLHEITSNKKWTNNKVFQNKQDVPCLKPHYFSTLENYDLKVTTLYLFRKWLNIECKISPRKEWNEKAQTEFPAGFLYSSLHIGQHKKVFAHGLHTNSSMDHISFCLAIYQKQNWKVSLKCGRSSINRKEPLCIKFIFTSSNN